MFKSIFFIIPKKSETIKMFLLVKIVVHAFSAILLAIKYQITGIFQHEWIPDVLH